VTVVELLVVSIGPAAAAAAAVEAAAVAADSFGLQSVQI